MVEFEVHGTCRIWNGITCCYGWSSLLEVTWMNVGKIFTSSLCVMSGAGLSSWGVHAVLMVEINVIEICWKTTLSFWLNFPSIVVSRCGLTHHGYHRVPNSFSFPFCKRLNVKSGYLRSVRTVTFWVIILALFWMVYSDRGYKCGLCAQAHRAHLFLHSIHFLVSLQYLWLPRWIYKASKFPLKELRLSNIKPVQNLTPWPLLLVRIWKHSARPSLALAAPARSVVIVSPFAWPFVFTSIIDMVDRDFIWLCLYGGECYTNMYTCVCGGEGGMCMYECMYCYTT